MTDAEIVAFNWGKEHWRAIQGSPPLFGDPYWDRHAPFLGNQRPALDRLGREKFEGWARAGAVTMRTELTT